MTRLELAQQKLQNLEAAVQRKLDRLSTLDPDPLISKAEAAVNGQGMMEQIIEDRFSSKSTDGRPWSPDKSNTTMKKSETGKSGGTLEGTGALRQAAVRAVAGTFRMRAPIRWDINKIGLRYAKPVQKKRPFFAQPSQRELAPAMKVAAGALSGGIKSLLG